jgi:hypothetical protein
MPSGIYPLAYEQICLSCYLDPGLCPEFVNKPTAEQETICPLRAAIANRLSAIQGKQLSEISRLRGYTPDKFLRMVQITVERNQIAGTV